MTIEKISIFISASATVAIAVLTFLYWQATDGMLNQMIKQNERAQQTIEAMQRANDLQRDYYQKTVRPFIYLTRFDFDFEKVTDSTVVISYYLKNIGSMPAKNVRSVMIIANKEERDSLNVVSFRADDFVVNQVFPDQERKFGGKLVPVRFLKQNRYIHHYVEYEDTGDKRYYLKVINFLKRPYLDLTKIKLSFEPIETWSDFN